MSSELKCKVYMVPDNMTGIIGSRKKPFPYDLKTRAQLRDYEHKIGDNMNDWSFNHLLFTSDREKKAGDTVCHIYANEPEDSSYRKQIKYLVKQIKHPSRDLSSWRNWRKVEATTDKTLKEYGIPLIGQPFVEAYIEAQGNIDDVILEVSDVGKLELIEGDYKWIFPVKTRADGTVIIHKLKNSWDREELKKELASLALIAYAREEDVWTTEGFNKWFNKNY